MDAIEQAIWADVEKHEDEDGCWTWSKPSGCNVIRLLAELSGKPLPAGRKMYRMPECLTGAKCVNPEHVGTAEQWMSWVRQRSEQI
jgi:hypothetical protein